MIRIIVRGVWHLADGRRITRAVHRYVLADPKDEERAAIVYDALLEEVQAIGHDFPKGHAELEPMLGAVRLWENQK